MSRFRDIAEPSLVGLLAALLYAPAAWNGFALDDGVDLLQNRFVTGPLDVAGIFSSDYYGGWGHMATGHYRPLVNLTYKLLASPFGLRPGPYHVFNIAAFALIAALVVVLGRRVSGDRRVGLICGLVFATHPVNSESVAAIAGLKELGAAGLGMLSVWIHIRGRESVAFAPRPARRFFAPAFSFAALLAALLYKETALAFLVVALAAEFLHASAPPPAAAPGVLWRLARGWPLASAVAIDLGLRGMVTGGLFRPTAVFSVDNPLVLLPDPFRRLAALALLPRYLALFFWPACLSSDYSEGSFTLPASLGDPLVIGGAATVLALAGAMLLACVRGRRTVALGLVAFGASYVLVSNVPILIGTVMAERLFFVPSWALSLTGAAVIALAWDRSAPLLNGRRRTMVGVSCLACLIVPLAVRTWSRIPDWADNGTLAASAARCCPGNVKVMVALAEREAEAGRTDEALKRLHEALAARPDSSYVQAAIGMHWHGRRLFEQAEPWLEACEQGREPIPGAVLALARMYLEDGRNDLAFRAATTALASGPSYADAASARIVRGEVLLARGDVTGAEAEYRLATREDPANASAHFNLGRCLESRAQWEMALEEYVAASSLAPQEPVALHARAIAEERLGRLEESLATTERLRLLRPGFAPAIRQWARLQMALAEKALNSGNGAEARGRYGAVAAMPAGIDDAARRQARDRLDLLGK